VTEVEGQFEHCIQPPLSEMSAKSNTRCSSGTDVLAGVDFCERRPIPKLLSIDAARSTRYCSVFLVYHDGTCLRYRVHKSWALDLIDVSEHTKLSAPSAWNGDAMIMSKSDSEFPGYESLICQLSTGDTVIVDIDEDVVCMFS
jgi:hypothetical protein